MRRAAAARSMAEREDSEAVFSTVPQSDPSGLYVSSMLFCSLPFEISLVISPFYALDGRNMKKIFNVDFTEKRAKWVKNGENGRLLKRKSK
jgi:hypothetical protein